MYICTYIWGFIYIYIHMLVCNGRNFPSQHKLILKLDGAGCPAPALEQHACPHQRYRCRQGLKGFVFSEFRVRYGFNFLAPKLQRVRVMVRDSLLYLGYLKQTLESHG